MYAVLRMRMKSMRVSLRKFSDHLREKEIVPHLPTIHSISRRVMKTAQKNEVMIPMMSVVAKPCTGPLPKMKRTIPVMMVVRLPSMMAE